MIDEHRRDPCFGDMPAPLSCTLIVRVRKQSKGKEVPEMGAWVEPLNEKRKRIPSTERGSLVPRDEEIRYRGSSAGIIAGEFSFRCPVAPEGAESLVMLPPEL